MGPTSTAGDVATLPETSGWAAESLGRSLLLGSLGASGLWQLVMIAAVLVSPDPSESQRLGLIAAHLLLIGLLILVAARRLPLWLAVLLMDGAMVADWGVAQSVNGVLSFATAWMADLTYFAPALLMTGARRWITAAVGIPGVSASMYLMHHDWLHTLVLPSVVTGTAIFVAASRSVPLLRAFASRVDLEVEANDDAARLAASVRAAGIEGAENARLLHDTVINTLAAVASGGGAVRDHAVVRDRCSRDVQTLEALLEADEVVLEGGGLAAILGGLPIDAVRSGAGDVELERALGGSPDVLIAVQGIVREAVQNAVKHAGVDRVHVAVTVEPDRVEVVIRDDGVGFDGRIVPGRGLDSSVFGRAAQAGIGIALDSAPGVGTTVSATIPLAVEQPVGSADFLETMIVLKGRGAWLWAAATAGIGIVLEVVNRFGQFTPAYGMVAVVAVSTLIGWLDVRRNGRLSLVATTMLVFAAPVAFVLALAGVDYGRHEVILWQSIGAGAPLVVLLVHGRTLRPVLTACGLVVAASVACTVIIAQSTPHVAPVIPIGTAPALGILGGWWFFVSVFERVGEQASRAQRAAARSRVEIAEREAATQARGRWRQAGLRRSLVLLQSLASGSVDPTDDPVRTACAEEEAYLRQLTLLDPNIVRLGSPLAAALSAAHERDVELVVRTGDTDVESDATAESLGALLNTVVGSADAGSRIIVSLFSTRGRLRLGIVGGPSELASSRQWQPPSGWSAQHEAYDGLDVLEIVRTARDEEAA
ncbi:MAG TPA: ATP-binding protein [Marmoricola sp.]|jgi:signal transduction histidine kinase|nr:ATP-binding protein [Marmoricola sp.]